MSEPLPRRAAISACISLGFMVADFAWLLCDEFKFIWPHARRFNPYTVVYLATRYTGLAGQIFNVYFSLRIASGIPATPFQCRLWFQYQAVTVQILLALVQISLMHRLYAVFLKNIVILAVLILMGAGQLFSMVVSARMVIPKVTYTETCYVTKTHCGTTYFGATTLAIALSMIFMGCCRYRYLPPNWRRSDFGRVVLRDSAMTMVVILVLALFMVLSTIGAIRTSINGNLLYYWLVCALWICLGRLIVNHAKVATRVNVKVFTLEIELEEMCTQVSEADTVPDISHPIDLRSAFADRTETISSKGPASPTDRSSISMKGNALAYEEDKQSLAPTEG